MDYQIDSVRELAAQVRQGSVTATALVTHSLAMIDRHNGSINAFVSVDAERALEQASAIDQLVEAGGDPGPLAGIPIGVKDLEDAMGFATTHGSPLYEGVAPAQLDSPLVARLRQAGCVVVGKTNTPEFGWTSRTENSLHGLTRNPWNLDHSPGGSSGGSAAAIAAGMVPLATGSDGGGSIRIPSAACGLNGMKASLGRVPAGGLEAPGWMELSSKGPMARSIVDVAAALEVVVGPDQSDLASLPRPEASWSNAVRDPRLPARIGWAPTLGYAEVDSEVLAACEQALTVIEELGIEIVEIEGPFDRDPVDEWLTIVAACLARSMGSHKDHDRYGDVDPTLQYLVDLGLSQQSVSLVEAIDYGHELNLKLMEEFHDVRLLVTPTTAGVTPPTALGGLGIVNGAEDLNWVRFTYPFNMTRSPAASVNIGQAACGVPLGLQLIGPQHGDLVVLRAAAALEEALNIQTVAPLANA